MIVYVALAFVAVLGFAGCEHQRARSAIANLETYKAEAQAKSDALESKNVVVTERVVTVYKDRIKVIREPGEVREIEIIRNSDCVLPPEFRVFHDRATGEGVEAPTGVDAAAAPVDPATVIETVRENYARARENAAQLEALQAWAAGLQ